MWLCGRFVFDDVGIDRLIFGILCLWCSVCVNGFGLMLSIFV